jgi:hypothetical protein
MAEREQSLAEKFGLTYTKVGDYYFPNLALDGDEDETPLGKYGLLRQTFLQEHHHGTYTSMLLTGRLTPHLREIDSLCRERVDSMVEEMKRRNGVDEAMKARDQMGWLGAVNSFIQQAEEIVLAEIVYQ